MKDRCVTLFDSGNKRFSTTSIPTASAAVAAVLQMGDKSKNRAFKVQDIVTTQKQLLKLGKDITPGSEWTIMPASTAQMAFQADETFKEDPNSMKAIRIQRGVGVFGAEYISDFGESDDVELGIGTMDETQLKELLKTFA